MNVKQLKDALNQYDDNTEVLLWGEKRYGDYVLYSAHKAFNINCSYNKKWGCFEEDKNGEQSVILMT